MREGSGRIRVAILACLTLTGAFAATAQATSPVGENGRIAFVRDVGNYELHLMGPDGSGAFNLLPGVYAVEPSFSPDGKLIAFRRIGPDYDIWVVGSDGTAARNLTNTPSDDERSPDISPDGRRIAFAREAAGGTQIVTAAIGGGREAVVVQVPASTDIGDPDFSPDGRRIAYATDSPAGPDIMIVNLDGSNPVNVTPGADFDGASPRFSPDGRRIVFRGSAPATGEGILSASTGTAGRSRIRRRAGGRCRRYRSGSSASGDWSAR